VEGYLQNCLFKEIYYFVIAAYWLFLQ